VNAWFSNNWKAFALVSGLIISTVGGYTNLLLELGELRAEVKFQSETIGHLVDEYQECK